CALHYVLVLANGDEEAAVAPPLRALHRAEHIGSAFKGGVNVCQRRLVNEVLGPLVTEFVPNFRREGATPIQRGSNASLLHRVQAIKLIVIDALISIPKHKSDKWLSKKRRSLSKKRHSRRRSVLAARDLKNSDGQTSSKNCSLNRDVECPSVGTIFAHIFSERSAMAAHLQLPRKKAPNPTDQHIGARVRMRRKMLAM